MRFDISNSTYPDGSTKYIARDKEGIVRLRENTLEELQEAIVNYNNALAAQAVENEKSKLKAKASKSKNKEVDQEKTEEDVEEPQATIEPQATQAAEPEHKDLTPPAEEMNKNQSTKEPLGDLLQNDIKEKVEEKKKSTSKKSFWDKLK